MSTVFQPLKNIYLKFKNRKSDSVLKHSSHFFAFTITITIMNILIRKYMSGVLPITDFGAYTAFLAFVAILAGPFQVIPQYITKKIAIYNTNNDSYFAYSFHKEITKYLLIALVFYVTVLMLFSPLLRDYYHLYSISTVLIAATLVFLMIFNSNYNASLQALQKYSTLGIIGVITKLFQFGIIAFIFRFILQKTELKNIISEYNWALFINVMSTAFALFISYIVFTKLKKKNTPQLKAKVESKVKIKIITLIKDIAPLSILFFSYQFISKIDENFARHYLSQHDSGIYGALISVGKSSMFLINVVIMVIFPKLSSAIKDFQSSKRIMLKGIILSLFISVGMLAAILIMPNFIIRVLTHSKYAAAGNYLSTFFIAFLPFSFLYIFINFFIVHKNWKYIIGIIAIITGNVIFYQFFHNSITTIITIMGITGYTMLMYSALFWYFRYIRYPKQTEDITND